MGGKETECLPARPSQVTLTTRTDSLGRPFYGTGWE
jgi:hypothetical protein